jgi:isocitrate dehydrogenase
MKEPVIVVSNVPDKIELDGNHNFNCNMTIGLEEKGDFYLFIEFKDLTMGELTVLAELSKARKAIAIKSDVILKKGYDISHIVVTKFSASSMLSLSWECLSDDPNFSLELE